MSTWLYENKEMLDKPDGYVGFIYIIHNNTNGRAYVGKKLFESVRRVKKSGKTRRVKKTKESDWKDYYGSNDELRADVERLGSENFSREVLHLCRSKGECNYLELKEQILRGALESDNFYNAWIRVRIHKAHIKKN